MTVGEVAARWLSGERNLEYCSFMLINLNICQFINEEQVKKRSFGEVVARCLSGERRLPLMFIYLNICRRTFKSKESFEIIVLYKSWLR